MSVCLWSVSKCLNMSLNFFIVWCFSHIKYIVGISTVIALAGGLPCNKLAIFDYCLARPISRKLHKICP